MSQPNANGFLEFTFLLKRNTSLRELSRKIESNTKASTQDKYQSTVVPYRDRCVLKSIGIRQGSATYGWRPDAARQGIYPVRDLLLSSGPRPSFFFQ